MQVRLAFSVAIKAEADVLLVDEVLAVGDADFQRKCFDYFKMLKKSKRTVVFISHDMNAVREFCDRAMLIEASKVITIDKAARVATQYSRLFITEREAGDKEYEIAAPDQTRWGDGAVKIERVSLDSNVLSSETGMLIFSTTIRASQDAEDLVMGFVVKDGFGVEICGTNTQIKGKYLGGLKKGETATLHWECANIFAEGKHTIDVAVHRVDGVTVHDWWEGAAAFMVKRTEKTTYRIAPPITVSIVR